MEEQKLNRLDKLIAIQITTIFILLLVQIIRIGYIYVQNEFSIGLFLFIVTGLVLIIAIAMMFTWWERKRVATLLFQRNEAIIEAISNSQAIIQFNMDGTILTANQKFLNLFEYSLDEIVGKHHEMFVESSYRSTEDYRDFWRKLNRGEYQQAEFKRIGKHNKEIWLLSTYTPILDNTGKPVRVIKVAIDITETKQQSLKLEKLTHSLKEMGEKILHDSNEVSVGSQQLESTVSEQVASAAQQATSVTEISTTIEEIKATTQQTLEKAKQLGDSAAKTMKESKKGKEALAEMSEFVAVLQTKMQHISTTILSLNDKTQQIREITEAVADIAKQLKMLALNAAIEAAKAGESGKGFAVVAGEVKELAERSQQSTDRVQKILQDIRQTAERAVMVTEEGTKSLDANVQQVKFTEETFSSLSNVIEESSLASMQIVSAVREESVAIDQVDTSIKEINKVTTVFSSVTEETQQAISTLSQIASSLRNTVEHYQASTKS